MIGRRPAKSALPAVITAASVVLAVVPRPHRRNPARVRAGDARRQR
ncbi:hypothetical protein [Nocardia canadensis]|nr:hypothetical protein [Nocardia canadensis]